MPVDDMLEVENLSVSFRTGMGMLRALRDVSLSVPRGEIVGIVGESGCGKSTLGSAVLGLLAENAEIVGGRALFKGEDLLTMRKDKRRELLGDRITTVFQDPMTALNPVMSIGTQMVAIQYRSGLSAGEKRRRAIEFLEKVRIPDPARRLRQYPHQFSGGMRQRICIAMALLSGPDLLIADEPTTALDATLEVQVIRLLKELQREVGCSMLFISHHLGVVAELCDRVVIMYAGEVVERGSVRDIFHDARHPYARKLIECDPARIHKATRTLPTIPGGLPGLIDVPRGCIFEDRCPERFDRCRERPEAHRLTTGHLAACHKAEQLAAA
jgi:oligopeptide/dipeptide ABC transporter ATP-binding protein